MLDHLKIDHPIIEEIIYKLMSLKASGFNIHLCWLPGHVGIRGNECALVYATGHIKDPVPLVEKSRGLSPGGRFPPSFIHQVIIITGLNKLQLYVLALKMALDADRA